MNTYICESLTVGIIHPSLSPAGAGFFFVEKKDKPLRPCINYRGLNAINAKNCYPLPLTSSAFELLQGATVFTKLDLQNAYHLVRIREIEKTGTVAWWLARLPHTSRVGGSIPASTICAP
ncbi:hypothetical protein QTP86_003990 [Hemibagrus guttatus]|nr:hypothetical protein QTP86_003990 [Hemibagrus guttatus]